MDRKQRILSFLSILITVCCTIFLIGIPSEEKSTFLFGYSAKRLALFVFFLIMGFCQIYLVCLQKDHRARLWIDKLNQQIRSNKIWSFMLGMALIVSWYYTFLPVRNFQGNQAVFERLKPVIVWIFLQVLIWFSQWIEIPWKGIFKSSPQKKDLVPSIIFILIASVIWITIAQTNTGLEGDVFWDSLGVPITITQVVATIYLLAIFRSTIGRKFGTSKYIDTILFLVLWIAAASLWMAAPQQTSTFNPGPFLPNGEFYPNSDAETYDACAYTAMQGQPYCAFTGNAVSKPLYTVFLFFLHLLSGNNYEVLINLQVIFIALLPALVYLIGRELHSRSTGLLAAILVIVKINNSIVHSLSIWTVSHPKFMMSEPFLSVFLALLCYFMIKWYRNPQGKRLYLYLSAAILGLSTLIRDNVWALLPVFMLVIFFRSKGSFWQKFFHFIQFGLVCLLIIVPWAARNISLGLTPVTAWSSLQHVIFENRYGIDTDEQSYEILDPHQYSTALDPAEESLLSFSNEKTSNEVAVHAVAWHSTTPSDHVEESYPNAFSSGGLFSTGFNSIISSTANHLLHNFLAIFLSLPMTLNTGDVEDLVSTTWQISPWARTWDGTLDTQAFFLIAINLVIVSLGNLAFKKKGKEEYLIPVLILLTYLVGVAFAKTSGGRYIVPVDWVVPLFYASGLVFLLNAIQPPDDADEIKDSKEEHQLRNRDQTRKPAVFLLLFLVLVSILLPLSEKIYPRVNYPKTFTEFSDSIAAEGNTVPSLPITSLQVDEFLTQENAVFLSGQALYPKVLDPQDDSATEFFPAQVAQPYSLAFTLLSGKQKNYIYIPINSTQVTFTHGITISILGCRINDELIKAKAVFLNDGEFSFLVHELDTLTCEEQETQNR